ncbi:hypothetical protein LVJ94_39600 [Pendulispora rubella]|uniref:Polysaccharide biosynthesis protein C-terminal domain-containing protein n=1 Tax=Pendulispora rubella TaxID=2741070 RepID=A0ABZ2KZL0_9BACT
MRGHRSLAQTVLLVLPFQIIFRAGEALWPLLLAFWFGRNHGTDVYYLAWAAFSFVGSLVFSAHQDSALVPILAEERLRRPKEVPRLLGSVLAHTCVLGGVLSAFVAAAAFVFFTLKYEGADRVLANAMILPFVLYLVVLSVRTFFATLLATEHHFVIQPVASGLGMMVAIAVLLRGHALVGIGLVPIASLAGELVSLAVLAWFALRVAKVKLVLNLSRTPALLAIAQLMVAAVGGGAITRINPVVDQLMAALTTIAGAGTMLRYSGDLSSVPTSLLQAALLPVLLARLSDQFAKGEHLHARRTVIRTLIVVCSLLAAASVLLYAVREPLVRFVFLRGAMDEEGAARIAAILPYHLIGLAPFGALLVLARAHMAAQNRAVFLRAGIFNAISNVVFNVLLLRAIGLEGLALATSCMQAAVAVFLWVRFIDKLDTPTAGPRGVVATSP